VNHLCKSLYSLKQAGCKWYDTLCCELTDLGSCVNNADPGIFSSHINNPTTIFAIHIDNCLITGSSAKLISDFKQKLNECYSLMDLGPIHWLLSIKITCNHEAHTISLSQMTYINTILSCFSLSNAKPFTSPISPSTNLSKADAPTDATEMVCMSKTPYHEAVGGLMYTAVTTQPDISFAVLALS
jgi:hypothetical protein